MAGHRVTYSGLVEASAECQDCGWECYARNAVGLGAQHSTRYGHYVQTYQTVAASYMPADHPERARRDEARAARTNQEPEA